MLPLDLRALRSVNQASWSLWEKATDGEFYELLAAEPGAVWRYGTGNRCEFACVRKDGIGCR